MNYDAKVAQAALTLGNTLVHGPSSQEKAATKDSPPSQSGTQIPVTPKPAGTEQVDGDAPSTPTKPGVGTGQPKTVTNTDRIQKILDSTMTPSQKFSELQKGKFNRSDYTNEQMTQAVDLKPKPVKPVEPVLNKKEQAIKDIFDSKNTEEKKLQDLRDGGYHYETSRKTRIGCMIH